MRRSVPRLGLARIASAIGASAAARVAPLEYRTVDPPELPGAGWHRVRTRLSGICGSDLSMIEGHASTYFDDVVSFPFVPGHEVVGELDDGTRVAIEPVLGHAARGFALPFDGAAPGDGDDYGHLVAGSISNPASRPGSARRPAAAGPPSSSPTTASSTASATYPTSAPCSSSRSPAASTPPCSPPVASRCAPPTRPIVAVLGAGTMGLAAIAGLVRYVPDATVVVGARYPHQQREARRLGAHDVVPAAELTRAVRRHDGCRMIGEAVSGGAHAVIDAVGSNDSIATALRITRPRGRTVLMGMPAEVTLDLTGLWHRETELVGAYTYGTEQLPDGTTAKTFDLAADTADAIEAERWVSATYRLADHVDAIAHAADAGRRGAIKIAFDLREKA